ncbi:dihydrodipicolinate synthase family protein [Lacticaseibacillus thailandensis]|nr:dihydrodipicolinate synthase family protein [Lacticaseibacillus thailandensis]
MTTLQPFQAAVPTAFNDDESLNVDATIAHIQYLAHHGIRSVLVSGATGEQHSLTLAEKQALAVAVNNASFPDDLEIIFGVASIQQREAVALATTVAAQPRISGILLGLPPYILPTQQEAANYVRAIMAAAQRPTILANDPHRTGFNLELTTLRQLVRSPQVVGLKEAGDPERVPAIRQLMGNDWPIYTGNETDLRHRLALGYNHLSSISANLYSEDMHTWFDHLRTGTQGPDDLMIRRLAAIHSGSTLTFVKARITAQEGTPMGQPRTPLGNFAE